MLRWVSLVAVLFVANAGVGDLFRSGLTETPFDQPSFVNIASTHGGTPMFLYVGGHGPDGSIITVYALDQHDNNPREVQVWTTPFRYFPSVMVVSPDNKHLYVAGGGYGASYSIFCMERSSTGQLTFISEFRTEAAGIIRDITFDSTGRRLYVGLDRAPHLAWAARDPSTGLISNFRRTQASSAIINLALSPNDAHLYVITYRGALALFDTTHPNGPALLDEHVFSDTITSGLAVTDQFVYAGDYQGLLTVWRRAASGRLSMLQPIHTLMQRPLNSLTVTPFALYAAAGPLGVQAWRIVNSTGRLEPLNPLVQWPGEVGGLIVGNRSDVLWAARARSRGLFRYTIQTEEQEQQPKEPRTVCNIYPDNEFLPCSTRVDLDQDHTYWCSTGTNQRPRWGLDRVPLEFDLTQSLNTIVIESSEGYVAYALSNQSPFAPGYESVDVITTRNWGGRDGTFSLTDMADELRLCTERLCCNVPREGGRCSLSQFDTLTAHKTDDCSSGWQLTHSYTSPGSRPDETILCLVRPPRPSSPLRLYQSASVQVPGIARRRSDINIKIRVSCIER